MALEGVLTMIPGLEASGDLSTKQHYCVKMSTTNRQVSLCDTDGEYVLGVLHNKPSAAGAAATVAAAGLTPVYAGEALAAGDKWKVGADGKAYKAEETVTGADVGDYVAGVVVEGAAADAVASVTIGMGSFRVEAQ